LIRDPRIDAYIAKSAPFAREILGHVRELVHRAVPEVEEAIKWGAPAYLRNGKLLLITAAFKAHAAVNFWRGQEVAGGAAKAGAMGQLGKLTSLADLPADKELISMVAEAADVSQSAPAPRKPKSGPKPPPVMHPDFETALADHPVARQTLEAFSPSARRYYLEWISEARQDATRAKRIATAIEWLAEGKKRHWKYENC
jgi:uncharacterized protein YdeI (YjbR/CyaY-like superfamily)